MRVLLAAKCDANMASRHEGWTPLHRACANGHASCVDVLLASGAAIGARKDNGRTPLHLAAIMGERACVGALLEHGADTTLRDGSGMTARERAQQEGHAEIARALTKHERLQQLAATKGAERVAPGLGSPPASSPKAPPPSRARAQTGVQGAMRGGRVRVDRPSP